MTLMLSQSSVWNFPLDENTYHVLILTHTLKNSYATETFKIQYLEIVPLWDYFPCKVKLKFLDIGCLPSRNVQMN